MCTWAQAISDGVLRLAVRAFRKRYGNTVSHISILLHGRPGRDLKDISEMHIVDSGLKRRSTLRSSNMAVYPSINISC